MSTDPKGETLNDGVIVELEVVDIPVADNAEVKQPQEAPQQEQQHLLNTEPPPQYIDPQLNEHPVQQPQPEPPQSEEPLVHSEPPPQYIDPQLKEAPVEQPQQPRTHPPQEEEEYKQVAMDGYDTTAMNGAAQDGNRTGTGRTDFIAGQPPPFDPTVDPSASAPPLMRIELKKETFDYWFIIYSTLIAMSIGVFIYIFTDLKGVIAISAGVGFVGATVYQAYARYKRKQPKSVAEYIAPSSDENPIISAAGIEFKEELSDWRESKEDDAVYVQTDFDNAYVDTVNEEGTIKRLKKTRKRAVNITGSTRAFQKKGSGVLMLEKRSLYTFQDYKGYEIGGGLSSMAGFGISIVSALVKSFVFSDSSDSEWGWQVLLIVFISFACLCLGCIIEMELRKQNILPPNKKLYQTATSIALHEIKSIDRHSTTNFQNVTSELDDHGGASMWTKKIAIKWFNSLIGILKILRWVFVAMSINTAFVMLVLALIEYGLLFDLTVNKSGAFSQTFPTMICLWVSVAIGVFAIYYTSQGAICHCGNKPYRRLSMEHRITQPHQKTLWLLFVSATVCLLIAAALVSYVDDQLYDRVIDTEEVDPIETNMNVHYTQYCIVPNTNNTDTRRRMQDGENSSYSTTTNAPYEDPPSGEETITIYTYEPFCKDSREIELMGAFYFVWIACYILVTAAYLWRKHDAGIFSFDLNNKLKAKRIWKRYSVLNIGLKTYKQDTQFHIAQFALFSFGAQETTISVELDPKEADKLHKYLNEVVPWYKTHAFYPHTLYSKIDYNQHVVRNNQDAYDPNY